MLHVPPGRRNASQHELLSTRGMTSRNAFALSYFSMALLCACLDGFEPAAACCPPAWSPGLIPVAVVTISFLTWASWQLGCLHQGRTHSNGCATA